MFLKSISRFFLLFCIMAISGVGLSYTLQCQGVGGGKAIKVTLYDFHRMDVSIKVSNPVYQIYGEDESCSSSSDNIRTQCVILNKHTFQSNFGPEVKAHLVGTDYATVTLEPLQATYFDGATYALYVLNQCSWF